jgi:hypothetical protein
LSTKYIVSLERDIERLKEALGIDQDAELTDELLQAAANTRHMRADGNVNTPTDGPASSSSVDKTTASASNSRSNSAEQHALLETMVEATGQLNIDERGNCDYCGNVAGLALIRRIRERCDALLEGTKAEKSPSPESFRPLTTPVRSPSLLDESKHPAPLPPKDVALQYVGAAFTYALPLLRFIHEPSFFQQFEQFYTEKQYMSSLANETNTRFEALLNELFALGVLFSAEPPSAEIPELAEKA